jgi:hypothetical protein
MEDGGEDAAGAAVADGADRLDRGQLLVLRGRGEVGGRLGHRQRHVDSDVAAILIVLEGTVVLVEEHVGPGS